MRKAVACFTGLFLFLAASLAFAAPGWNSAASLQLARTGPLAVRLDDGQVLVAGGFNGGARLNSAELYNPLTDTWSSTGTMTSGRQQQAMVKLLNGKVLAVGGYSNMQLKTAELYDPVAGTWTAVASMAGARVGPSATLLTNGKVLVVGGGSADLYDPVANTWASLGSLPSAGGDYHTATRLANGKVLIAGGVGAGYSANTALFDPATNTWAATEPMSIGRGTHTATLLANGKVLVVGGVSGSGSTYLASTELYDADTGTWAAAASLSSKRSQQVAVLLNDGKVLVVAGKNEVPAPDPDDPPVVTTYASAEQYDPVLNVWTAAGTMAQGRTGATITLLADGKVLVAAGGIPSGQLASAELYDPPVLAPPAAPSIGTATAGNAQATISFTAPGDNGGSAILGYTVVSIPAGGVDSNAGSTGLSHVVTGLVNGTTYTFTVAARNSAGVGVASAPSNSVTPLAPAVVVPTPPIPSIPILPSVVLSGISSLPAILDINSGSGPDIVGGLAALLSQAAGMPVAYAGQTSGGSVVFNGTDGRKLSVMPIAFQTGDPRSNGIYPVGNGQYHLVFNGQSVLMVPALISPNQLIALLPGVSAQINDYGVITANVNGLVYVVQPDVQVQTVPSGMAQLTTDADGVVRFIDATGNSQILFPAFHEPLTIQAILQTLDANVTASLGLNGTATIVLNGQFFNLVPDMTLGGIPAERLGQRWWQEGPNRYRVVNQSPAGTSQGFTVR